MNDTMGFLSLIGGAISLIAIIIFFIMANNISKMLENTRIIKIILQLYAQRDELIDEKNRIIEKEKKPAKDKND